MSIGRTASRILIGGAAVLALSGAGQAFAGAGENLDSSVYGAKARSHGTNGQVAISDTAADRHSVYTLYDRRDNTGLRLDNSRGNGSTVYSGMNENNYVRKVTACVNIQLSPDSCGADDRPGDEH